MSVQVENLEKNMAKLTAEIPAEDFEKAVQASYIRNKNRFTIPGFRRGKAPRKVIERMYGQGIFYEEAINEVLPSAYEAAAKESGLDIVSDPAFSIESIEDGKTVVFSAEVAVRPEVKLGDYKGIEITKHSVRVTKEEIENELEKERQKNVAQVTVDREVKEDDIAVIDYEGFLPGETVPFKGGKGENFPLTIGSGAFIPGFEDQIIGHKAGEEFEINVKFPEEYHSEELKGRDAIFKVAVKEVKENQLPELDDDFAGDVSEFDTLEEYKADIKKNLTMMKKAQVRQQQEEEAAKIVTENAEFDLPEAMVETRAKEMLQQMSQRMQENGFTLEQYMQMMQVDADVMIENMKKNAEEQLSQRLVLQAIAKAEGIQASDEDFDKEIQEMAEAYDMSMDQVRKLMGEKGVKDMRDDLDVTNALNFVVDNAKEVAKKDEEKKDEKADEEKKPAKKSSKKKAEKADEPAAEEAAEEAPAKKTSRKSKKAEEPAEAEGGQASED